MSLTVDVGRIKVAKGQIQTAADAAAMAAVLSLPQIQLANSVTTPTYDFGKVDQAAVSLAAANKVTIDNVAVTLLPGSDIEYGSWNKNTKTFTHLGWGGVAGVPGDARQSANAIRVTAWRTADKTHNNPLPLTFAQIFGQKQSNLEAIATAIVEGAPSTTWGIVGITSINLGGNATIDSYLPSQGAYSANTKRYHGNVASNGNIATGNGWIYGDARPGIGMTFSGHSTGYTAPLDKTLVFPPPVVPPGTAMLPSASSVPGGTYQTPTAPSGKTFTGPVSIYITGNNAGMSLKGNTQLKGLNSIPANLKLYFVSGGSIDQKGTTDIYAEIYAPLCSYSMNGNNGLYGSLIANTIAIQGTPDIHYDEGDPGVNNRSFEVILVQ